MWDALVALVASVFIFLGAVLQIFWRHLVQAIRGDPGSSKSTASGPAASSVVAEKTRTGPFASSEETGGSGGSSPTPRQPLLAASSDLGDEAGGSLQGDLLPGDYPDDVLEGGGDGSRVVRRGSLRPSYKDPAPVYKEPGRQQYYHRRQCQLPQQPGGGGRPVE